VFRMWKQKLLHHEKQGQKAETTAQEILPEMQQAYNAC